MNSPITFLHLSDIHLRESELNSSQDLDEDIRREVERDLRFEVLPQICQIDGILVSGDVAFAGTQAEYESAKSWLRDLCNSINCSPENVWTVPGNHDVVQRTISKSVMLQDQHDKIREADDPAAELHRRTKDPQAIQTLLSPLENYNQFATPFGCSTTAKSLTWSSDFSLNDGSSLRIWGINSVLVSDSSDSKKKNKMVVGQHQVQLPNEDGVSYLTLCHHPPSWLLDEENVTRYLSNRAQIQLYGHEHQFANRKIDESLQIFAGALHPSRKESGWEPRYNILRIQVAKTKKQRTLRVEVFARQWKAQATRFGPNYNSRGEYPYVAELALGSWDPPHSQNTVNEKAPPTTRHLDEDEKTGEEGVMLSTRQLVYLFFEIPYPERMKIIIDLGLLEAEDYGLLDSELLLRVVERAKEKEQLEELKEAVSEASNKERGI